MIKSECFCCGLQTPWHGGLLTSISKLDLDQLPGTLRWTDLPDPAGARPVSSRMLINIEGEMGLCRTLTSMQHRYVHLDPLCITHNSRFTREFVQECYRFVHKNVVFEMSRYLQLPPNEMETLPTIRNYLPPYETLIPFDSENKWVMMASAVVLNGNDPEQMQRGIDELVEAKTDFEGCFDFQAPDRHIFDTRVKF